MKTIQKVSLATLVAITTALTGGSAQAASATYRCTVVPVKKSWWESCKMNALPPAFSDPNAGVEVTFDASGKRIDFRDPVSGFSSLGSLQQGTVSTPLSFGPQPKDLIGPTGIYWHLGWSVPATLVRGEATSGDIQVTFTERGSEGHGGKKCGGRLPPFTFKCNKF